MQNQIVSLISPYFEWLDDLFGHLALEATKNNISAGAIARDYLSSPTRRQHFREELPRLYQTVDEFWKTNSKAVDTEIRKLPGLKVRFGGDIGPQVSDAVFQRTGLYFESIIIPDPLLRVMKIPEDITKTKDYYFLKYGISQVILKDVYLADIFPPLAVLAGDVELEGTNIKDNTDIAMFDCVLLTNVLYGENFDNFGEVQEHFARFGSIREAITTAQKPELLYWDENTPLDPLEQWDAYIKRSNLDWELRELPQHLQGPEFLLFTVLSRMIQANSVMFGASVYDANPLITAPVSFHWLNWKIRVNRDLVARSLNLGSNLDLALTNALLSKDLKWLSNVPIESLVELRRKGRLSELRSLVNRETVRLANSRLDNLEAITNQVDYNLASALERHQEEIEKLDKAFRTEMSVLGSTFLLSTVGALQPQLIPLAPEWAVTLSGVIGTTSLAAIVPATINYLREKKNLGKTPIGILWKAKERSHI